MRSIPLFIILLFISISDTYAQLNLTVGEKFLDGKVIKQVFVAVEDHSVWALTIDGKVFLKRPVDADFIIYQPTSMFEIDQVSGFNESEMYFLLKPDIIIYFKSGIKYEIKVPFPDVTRINDISVVYPTALSTYYINNPQTIIPNYLAVATNKHLYKLVRGDVAVTVQIPYDNPPIVNEPNWRITNKGYKSVDFQYEYPNYTYCKTADHVTVNYIGGSTTIVSILPDQAPDYSTVNASLMALGWREYATPNILSFWGNNNDLFVMRTYGCSSPIKKVIANETINDLEEIFALTPIYRQNFVLAATNNGLYYTPSSIFHELYGYSDVNRVKFVKHNIFPNEKIYSLSMDTKVESIIDISSGWYAPSVCEKILWVASSTGLRKVYATLDQDYYKDFAYSDFHYLGFPKNTGDFSKLVFEICGSQVQTITARIPEVSKNEVLTQWYKDDIEITDWIGKLTVDLKESGTYKVKITVLCEGISLTSIPIVIINNPGPEITFSPPSNVNICNNQPYVMETKSISNYSYQWYKDEVKIIGATQFHYSATATGKYKVEVNNNACPGAQFSSSVSLNFITMDIPNIAKDKVSYCVGEVATLSIANSQGYQTKWYLNGVELTAFANQNELTTTTDGKYKVELLNTLGCSKSTSELPITFNNKLSVVISASVNKAICEGESVKLSAGVFPNANYLWSNGEKTETISVTHSGTYWVQVSSEFNCATISDPVEVKVNPLPSLTTNEKLKICTILKEELTLNAEPGFLYYTWNGKSGIESSLKVNQPGIYSVEVEDINGCKASKIFEVIPYCKEIIAPNAFSPNGDGINDFWRVGGLENEPNSSIQIFNRLGVLVFNGRGNNPVWDGNIKNSPAPIGVYYYVITTSTLPQSLNGTLTLLR
ncbi:T9SS type B sorting domain-containing protein [Pedobacter sp. LMG 31464]|uniref:T9SS type B sorting domain-containing protein n=1 Tax=Pedobacter planticolens TaxID=2679964 RepID=A0A923DVG6_9SPHI|nr:gliding motility-associated C-terminal domain-containing protein [Pedobacter planticolens]MBB2144681.1 T9SS type B sorting domain-containing protein [Pedobacter planticolens]